MTTINTKRTRETSKLVDNRASCQWSPSRLRIWHRHEVGNIRNTSSQHKRALTPSAHGSHFTPFGVYNTRKCFCIAFCFQCWCTWPGSCEQQLLDTRTHFKFNVNKYAFTLRKCQQTDRHRNFVLIIVKSAKGAQLILPLWYETAGMRRDILSKIWNCMKFYFLNFQLPHSICRKRLNRFAFTPDDHM